MRPYLVIPFVRNRIVDGFIWIFESFKLAVKDAEAVLSLKIKRAPQPTQGLNSIFDCWKQKD